ncbi:MAG: biotin transporter BioY [Chloroflexi bacterium]|nr:biotin transporter BioY [Chloroflexota bacterium]
MVTNTLERWKMARYNAFVWRHELSLVKKIALALGFAALTGLLAQARIPLPWTPVPITGQTFAVLLAGVALGQWWGGISIVLYALLGIAGIPWFNGGGHGIAQLAGPTGGYIVGFILAAFFVGHFTDKYVRARKFTSLVGLLLAANFVLVYVPGLVQLHAWLNLVQGKSVTFVQVLGMGLLPFIAGDIIKAVAAAGVAWGITPKQAFNGEVDSK